VNPEYDRSSTPSLLATLKSIASLLLSYGLLLMANGLFSTLLSVRTSIEGFSTEVVGVIMGSFFIGLFLGARYAVRVVAGVGHIRSFAAFASIMSITALTHALIIDPASWIVMRIASGFCMAGMIIVTESWLNERASNEMRGRVLSIYMTTNYAAAGCGQFLLPLADPGRFHLFSLTSIIFSLALVPVLLTRSRAPLPARSHPVKLRKLYQITPLGLVGSFCAGMANAMFYSMGPIFTRGIGLPLTGTSIFMASAILGGLVLQWPIGRLSDRVDRRFVMTGIAFTTCAACISILWFARVSEIGLYVAGAVYGSLAFTIYSLSAAHTNDFADPEELLQVSGALLVSFGIGAIFGPMIGAFSMGQFGPNGLFGLIAIITALLGIYSLYRINVRDTKTTEEKSPFVPVPSTQYTSEEIYGAALDKIGLESQQPLGETDTTQLQDVEDEKAPPGQR